MTITEFYESPKGDIYSISLSSEYGGLIADDIRKELEKEGVALVDVELNRIKGANPTTTAIISKIGDMIANFFFSNPNVVICYYCDFLSQLPYVNNNKKKMSVQEYRHHLFSNMFDHYVTQHHIENVSLAVLTIEGSSETYYVHVITRNMHLPFVAQINNGIQRDFSKP